MITSEYNVKSAVRQLNVVPFPLVMLLLCLALGLATNMELHYMFKLIGEGFGAPLGEIALTLIPSFTIASAISQSKSAASGGGVATAIAPFAGAAMVCPDTAYAALSPMSANRKLSVLFGSYAGFKLLIPAGPAIVAAALGGLTPKLIAWSVILFVVCWLVGLLYARQHEETKSHLKSKSILPPAAIAVPLALLVILITIGAILSWRNAALPTSVEFLFNPKGALIIAAIAALSFVDHAGRAKALESGIKRTAPLLLMIGAASALGTVLVTSLPFDQLAQSLVSTGMAIPALFLLTVSFKVAKGSSMATFAGTSGLVAALLPNLNVSPEAATLAMCAGAFVTIAPNDSLYWLVRQDAFASGEEHRATWVLGVGATLQGLAAIAVVQCAVWVGFL